MEIVKRGNPREVTCTSCNTVLRWTVNDLMWSHNEPDYYYFVCPVCNTIQWVKRTDELDRQWDAINNPAFNPYATPANSLFGALSQTYKQTI